MKCWTRAVLWWWWAFADWDYRDAYWAHCDASDTFWAMVGGAR